MVQRKRSDLATIDDVDWGFLQDEVLVGKLRGQARGLSLRYGVDFEELLQDTYLWLAVRPDLQGRSHGMILGQTRSVGQQALARELRQQHEEYPDELL